MTYDCIIVGGGIVGISTALQLQQRFPHQKILLLEKEPQFCMHQSGHNSGVIHAGVYYAPGSLKAQFCKAGSAATIAFCKKEKIPYLQCGKLLVATSEAELARMEHLRERCLKNEIEVEQVTTGQLRSLEPNIIGLGALLVKQTAIVDYRQVALHMVRNFLALGGEARLDHRVSRLQETDVGIAVTTQHRGRADTLNSSFLVSCSGLMADRLTRMLGIKTPFRIIPFRGEYYRLSDRQSGIIRHLIYPVPDPELPFLGVHLTRMIDGSVTIGPNAVLGWKREGYGRINVNLQDIRDMVAFTGFWKVIKTHFRSGLLETKNSLWKPGYLKQVKKYCPQLQLSDLKPYPAGVRAQAVLHDGSLVQDFLFAVTPRSLHVCNAPSPAATSAIPIGQYICDKVAEIYPG